MDHVKLPVHQYDEGAMIRAGEAAEVLWTRAFAKCGAMESDGFIPDGLPERLCPTKTKARIAALVREGLWTVVDGGWQMDWTGQISSAELQERRDAGARRQKEWRERARQTKTTRPARRARDDGSNTSRDALLTGQEVEVEVEDAAAAASRDDLPPPLVILRAALEARKLLVRWDRLTNAQVTEIETLVEVHGDAALVASAVRDFRPDAPAAFAQAWLPSWRQLRRPGDLAVVPDLPCPEPGHAYGGGTVRHCVACVAEANQARADRE